MAASNDLICNLVPIPFNNGRGMSIRSEVESEMEDFPKWNRHKQQLVCTQDVAAIEYRAPYTHLTSDAAQPPRKLLGITCFVARSHQCEHGLAHGRNLLGEIHHYLAEINRCKLIKRTELFPIPGVESSNRSSGSIYENQII